MKTFIGLVIGSVLTFLFLKFGYTPPVAFQIPEKLKAIPEQLIASSFIEDVESTLEQRQRGIATLIKYDPDYFIEIDNAIENQFTEGAKNKIADRRLRLLEGYSVGIDKAFDKGQNAALRKELEKLYGAKDKDSLKKKMLMKQIRQDPLVYKVLQERYPGYSDEKIAEIVLGIPQKQ